METAYHTITTMTNCRPATRAGVSRTIASSNTTRQVMMSRRMRPSHPSQVSSLNQAACGLCVPAVTSSSVVRQLANHREHRRIERDHNSADHAAQQADHHRFHEGEQVFGGGIYFVVVEVGEFLQHGSHRA